MSSTNDPPRQVRKLVDWVAAKATKADSEFHHPISAGEILLQNFPVQATINLYEDSNSEEEEEGEDDEEKEEANEKRSEGHVKGPGSIPHRATAHLCSPSLTCPKLK
ncbi:Protein ripply1 [Heterocephalus glaber]|uniref:Protein ripply1 n=1 Tax=Heterocephalus glaber TaxID=10181 RepID=G5C3Z1_HETGA|nr:protein ripply1 [Heterocephalus glaber]EHB16252.1 Protein ripply1 [Heterocephalus glaber]